MEKTKSLALILGVLATSVFVSYLVLAWTEPSSAPPAGNVSAPINVGTGNQIKAGGLGISGGFFVDSPTLVIDAVNDRVGIGTTTPSNIDLLRNNSPFASISAKIEAYDEIQQLKTKSKTFSCLHRLDGAGV
ncbi:hypothetical protein KKH59_03190 [Patescibacteria group bacterium]|nr:hypothetical protein [Patescibacteria group bacterium]